MNRYLILLTSGLALLATLLSVRPAAAWEIANETKLAASDGDGYEFFGEPVALSGSTAIVGVPRDDDNGPSSGSAYVYVRDGLSWSEEAKLLPDDGAEGDQFGEAVAIFGDTVLVGAPYADAPKSASGAAYVFTRRDGVWTQQAKLVPSDSFFGDFFGNAVSLSGDTALIGALGDDPHATQTGSAYVFVRSGEEWIEQDKLIPSDWQEILWFGWSVSVWGDYALVGVPFDGAAGEAAGSAYVFVRDGDAWSQQAKLLPSAPAAYDLFGHSVSLSADTALVGAPTDRVDFGTGRGSSYVFARTAHEWIEQVRLQPPTTDVQDQFGWSVSLFGDRALVGSPYDDENGEGSGSAYLYERIDGVWIESAKVLARDGARADAFGSAVSIYGSSLLVGAPLDDEVGINSGSAWVYEDDALGLTVVGTCPGPVTVKIGQAPPSSEVAVLAAANDDGFTKGGALCNGAQLDIGEPFQLPPTWLLVDTLGNGSADLVLENDRCWVEALAVATCETSGAIPVP